MKVALREPVEGRNWCLEIQGTSEEIDGVRPLLRELCQRGNTWLEPMDRTMFRDAHPVLPKDDVQEMRVEFWVKNQEIVLEAVMAFETMTGYVVS